MGLLAVDVSTDYHRSFAGRVIASNRLPFTGRAKLFAAFREQFRGGGKQRNMRNRSIIAAGFSAVLIASWASAQPSSAIPGVVAADAKIELVGEYFQNTEGPLGDADGNLYFSDTDANRTYMLD